MGVIRKIVLSLFLVANLAHGQLSVDLNGGDLTAPLQHQGKIEQQYSPGNIKRTYGRAPGQNLAPFDENIETIYVSPEGRSNYRPNYLRRTGSQDPTTNLKNLRRSTGLRRTDYDYYDYSDDPCELGVLFCFLAAIAPESNVESNELKSNDESNELKSNDESLIDLKSNDPASSVGFFDYGLGYLIKKLVCWIFWGLFGFLFCLD